VLRSVVSPDVVVEEGAVVRDSILHHGTIIRAGAVVDRAILDKEVTVGAGAVVGFGGDNTANHERPDIVNTGISIIGKRVVLPGQILVGRNVVVGPGVEQELADISHLESGSTVLPTQVPLHLFV
jgi:glucose-1-phosphate adenylyltransferase